MDDAWPGLSLDPAVFAQRCAELGGEQRPDRTELVIAIAIEARVPGAVDRFERRYFARIPTLLNARGATDAEVDEVMQQVRIRLLAPAEDGTVPLVRYAGHGQLDGLVRITAIRAFLNMREKTEREVYPADFDNLLAPAFDGPERILADAERRDLKDAFGAAVEALPARERSILRMHLVNGVSIDAIAKMLGAHRATAARRLARLKDDVVERVRVELAARWGNGNVLERVTSQVDLSLDRLLASKVTES